MGLAPANITRNLDMGVRSLDGASVPLSALKRLIAHRVIHLVLVHISRHLVSARDPSTPCSFAAPVLVLTNHLVPVLMAVSTQHLAKLAICEAVSKLVRMTMCKMHVDM